MGVLEIPGSASSGVTGQVQDSALICSEVDRMNARTRIVIHTIGVGPDHDADLLKRLSADSQGTYVRAR